MTTEKYTIIDNPPPMPKVLRGSGNQKGELRLALEAMTPGQGLFVPGKDSKAVGPHRHSAMKASGHVLRVRTHKGGCFVWCFAAEEAAK